MNVDVCLDLVQTSQQVETGDWATRPLPKPHEIRAALDQYVIGQDVQRKHFQLQCITITNV
jgi:ATP-dependent Clp protease ATP-binding subunit ClpX